MKKCLFFVFLLPALCSCDRTLYVSPEGDDASRGTRRHPLNTIAKAADIALSDSHVSRILLRGGRYEIAETIELNKLHDVEFVSCDGEEAVVSGSLSMDPSVLQPVSDADVLGRIKESARDKVRELDLSSVDMPFGGIVSTGFAFKQHPSWTEVIINDSHLRLARWPKDRAVRITKVYSAGRRRRAGDTTFVPLPVIGYDTPEIESFSGKEGLWMWGYFSAGYAANMIPVADIDPETKKITLSQVVSYGFSENKDGWNQQRWAMMNVLEELTEPGEYVIDAESRKFYLIPPEDGVRSLEVSRLDTTMVRLDSCANVVFLNIVFQGGRGDGAVLEGCRDCVFEHCTFRNLGHLALHIAPGKESLRNGVRSCRIYDTGSGGIELFGGDRLSLTHGECFVENCEIHDVNRLFQSYRPPVKFGECGNRVSHCEIYNAPSMAILFNGNDQLIEYTDIHDVCKDICDQGSIYYGRNPTERGSRIMYSYIHDIQSSEKPWVFGIYHDDGACGVDVYGCAFNNIETSAVDIGGGSDISYKNCIFMNMPEAYHIDDRIAINNSANSYRKKFEKVNYKNPPFSEAYPELPRYFDEHPENPKRIVMDNNLYFNIKEFFDAYVLHSKDYLEGWGEHNWRTDKNPWLVDENDPSKGMDLDSLRQYIPDFEPIPFDEIGCNIEN